MKIIITGFEEFGGMPANPSRVLVESLSDIEFEGNLKIEIKTKILPVDFQQSGLIIKDLLLNELPDLLLMTGVDIGKKTIELETTAHKNYKHLDFTILDLNDIDKEDLLESYRTSINTKKIVRNILNRKLKLIAIESDDTGAYVCNHIYYISNILIENLKLRTKTLFVHLPYPYPYFVDHKKVKPLTTIKDIQDTFLHLLTDIIEQQVSLA